MRVLHVTNNYPTINYPVFGIFLKEQIDSLTQLGINNDVFFINTREKGKAEYLFSIFRLLKVMIKNKYDLIHCHHAYSGFVFLITGISVFMKKMLTYQGTPDIEGGQTLFKLYCLFFDTIIIKANFENYRHRKVIYLPNGTNLDLFIPMQKDKSKKELKLDLSKQYILFMDSYAERRTYKRFDRYQKVIQILKEKHKIENLEELILTNTKRELIPFYINASALHLLTSDVEGSPNSVKECLACNIPVVTTPVGNVHDLINGIEGCYISNTFDEDEIATLVVKALKIKEINGRERLKQKGLDIKNVAIKIKAIYSKIIYD